MVCPALARLRETVQTFTGTYMTRNIATSVFPAQMRHYIAESHGVRDIMGVWLS